MCVENLKIKIEPFKNLCYLLFSHNSKKPLKYALYKFSPAILLDFDEFPFFFLQASKFV
jgi:hypothetical protein